MATKKKTQVSGGRGGAGGASAIRGESTPPPQRDGESAVRAKSTPRPQRDGAGGGSAIRGESTPRPQRDGESAVRAKSPSRPQRGATKKTDEEGGEVGEADERDEGSVSDGDDESIVDAADEVVDDDGSADGELAEGEEPKPREPADEDERAAAETSISRHDPLKAYLHEVQRHKLLTPEESHALAVKYVETGDVDAARRLVTANLRLVVKIAYEYRRAYKNVMDLIQEGNIGLMQAVRKFDPHRGVKLSSYSAWWIRAYILRYIVNNWRLVKLGTTQAQRKLFFNLKKEKARLSAMGIDPTPDEVAKRLGVEPQEVIEMDHRLSSAEASLDAPVGDSDGRAVSRIDLLPSSVSGPDTRVADAQLSGMVKERLAEFRKTLSGKDVVIFDERLVSEDPLTLQELGDRFGVSRERVRQLEARLTSHLRAFLEEQLGDAVRA